MKSERSAALALALLAAGCCGCKGGKKPSTDLDGATVAWSLVVVGGGEGDELVPLPRYVPFMIASARNCCRLRASFSSGTGTSNISTAFFALASAGAAVVESSGASMTT